MKIAFPLTSESELASNFTTSRYVGIYDLAEESLNVIPLAPQPSATNQGLIFETMKRMDTRSVVGTYFSFMALRVLKENKFNVHKAIGSKLHDNIIFFKTGMLKPFSTLDVFISHNNCADGCSGCGSQCVTK